MEQVGLLPVTYPSTAPQKKQRGRESLFCGLARGVSGERNCSEERDSWSRMTTDLLEPVSPIEEMEGLTAGDS